MNYSLLTRSRGCLSRIYPSHQTLFRLVSISKLTCQRPYICTGLLHQLTGACRKCEIFSQPSTTTRRFAGSSAVADLQCCKSLKELLDVGNSALASHDIDAVSLRSVLWEKKNLFTSCWRSVFGIQNSPLLSTPLYLEVFLDILLLSINLVEENKCQLYPTDQIYVLWAIYQHREQKEVIQHQATSILACKCADHLEFPFLEGDLFSTCCLIVELLSLLPVEEKRHRLAVRKALRKAAFLAADSPELLIKLLPLLCRVHHVDRPITSHLLACAIDHLKSNLPVVLEVQLRNTLAQLGAVSISFLTLAAEGMTATVANRLSVESSVCLLYELPDDVKLPNDIWQLLLKRAELPMVSLLQLLSKYMAGFVEGSRDMAFRKERVAGVLLCIARCSEREPVQFSISDTMPHASSLIKLRHHPTTNLFVAALLRGWPATTRDGVDDKELADLGLLLALLQVDLPQELFPDDFPISVPSDLVTLPQEEQVPQVKEVYPWYPTLS